MNALVKKEIRLLLPSFIVAVFLAMIQGITRPYDFYVASLLFFGLTIMALTTIGRETSLNTFSLLMSQPAERMRIWQTKLSVLAGAFLIVFFVWLAAFGIAFRNSSVDADAAENSYNLFIAICLIATAAFTGGLWTTLLLRQVAGAFWLTLLVPAVLAGFTGGFVAANHSNNTVIAVLCVVLGIYSVGGFLFAHWLFFRAQDVGWSGGVISIPEWKLFGARSESAVSTRSRKPIFALFKKELQLHQVTLMGAAGLLVLHIGIIILRTCHHFAKDSAGEVLTEIFWLLWLVMPVVIGALAVAEERRLGMMDGQLCLPVSRRIQFVIKAFLTLLLGIFLGGVMPMLLETVGAGLGAKSLFGREAFPSQDDVFLVELGLGAFVAWLALVSFFASTLAKSFLQAVGFGVAVFFGCVMVVPLFTNGRMFFFDSIPAQSILPLIIAVPTIIVALLWLAYLNFNNFRDGWTLWRRNLLGFAGAIVFIVVSSLALYHRVWEVFEPAEPPHGPAKLTLANPPTLKIARDYNLLVRLPDGRVWFDMLGDSAYGYYGNSVRLKYLWPMLAHPLPESLGPRQFLAGSNWVAATTAHMYFGWKNDAGKTFSESDFMETVGIQPDGTLWISEKPESNKWTPGALHQFGSETNWRQLAHGNTSVVLLKTDGTLWRWGSLDDELHQWPGLRTFTPYQIGTNADWQELFTVGQNFARQTNGRVWLLGVDWKTGRDELVRATNYDEVALQTASRAGDRNTAFVRADGTLWVLNRYWDQKSFQTLGTGILQVGKENDWRAVAVNWSMMVALKADGSLWQWNLKNGSVVEAVNVPPTRLGIHDDWVAIKSTWGNVIALAADGSLWLWPDKRSYDYGILIKLPKQPQYLGNIFGKPD
jgi:hypothetical protein